MLRCILLAILLALLSIPVSQACNVTEYRFETVKDHFRFDSPNDTFSLRYYVNDHYWKSPNGPCFFYAGNEASIRRSCRTSFATVSMFFESRECALNFVLAAEYISP